MTPTTFNWEIPANWTPATVPDGPNDTATFGVSNSTNPTMIIDNILSRTINGIVFNPGASAFTITVAEPSPPKETLTISGVGITNNSGITQNIETGDFGYSVFVNFTNSATAGDQTVLTAGPNCCGVSVITFLDTSTAGNATLIANPQGVFTFAGDSTGGTSRVEVFIDGSLDISGHNAPGVTVGSIEGTGTIILGVNNLTVGNNNLSTIFSGVIRGRGSLTKIGTGRLTLSGSNEYSGGTIVSGGTVLVNNKRRTGTGKRPVQVNAGTVGGKGTIGGAVTIGTGSGSGAFLSPGVDAVSHRTLTIHKTLTFDSDGTYKCGFNSGTAQADKVVANGASIDSGAQFVFADSNGAVLASGTTFTAIDNTAATPISGTFSNLADGSTFTVGSNTFQASYSGGNGNDLTLTVVP